MVNKIIHIKIIEQHEPHKNYINITNKIYISPYTSICLDARLDGSRSYLKLKEGRSP